MDVDLGLGVSTKQIFIVTYDGKIFITVDGLGQGNVVYTAPLTQ
jgi:hypothetical protein